MTFAHINPVLKDGANKLIFFVLASTRLRRAGIYVGGKNTQLFFEALQGFLELTF